MLVCSPPSRVRTIDDIVSTFDPLDRTLHPLQIPVALTVRSSRPSYSHQPHCGVAELPVELLLEIFSFLPLKYLIAARGVNQHWRALVPSAKLPPARRALYDLYYDTLASPSFLPSRPRVLARLKSFDRELYLDRISQKGGELPEEFRLWILEWPAKAAFRSAWPGLANEATVDPFVTEGANCLTVPQVREMRFFRDGLEHKVPALDVWWYGFTHYASLLLHSSDTTLDGAVYVSTGVLYDDSGHGNIRIAAGWVGYLRQLLKSME
ncbi:hypothetical protein HGRIS_006197 [Hohenbuehelia grisea]|uniref:F-box domain-containing protein n=1 Tax=Hohenbuehelia grisea TaxID=104357 RepID=A0ABR3JZM3_9AGAR